MENRTRYRLGEVEEKLSEMEFEDRCDEIVEIDDDMQLVVSGWYVFIPGLSLYLRAGVACVYDEEAGMYMPNFDVTVLYEEELDTEQWIYYEQDGFVWVYPGQNNSNFRLNWIADGEVDEATFFAQTGAALREAMGDSMVSDPGEAARSLDMRGVAMDAMIYAYTDVESGAIVEGAYLWEQR